MGEAGMGKVHLPSFQAALRALKRNLKPWARGTAAHGLCLTAGPRTLASLPGRAGVNSRGNWESQHLHRVLLQPLSPFQVQTNKDGRRAGTWTVWLQVRTTQLCLLSRSANRRRCFKQTLNKKEKQQDPCAHVGRWAGGQPTCSVTLLSFHPGPSLLGVDPEHQLLLFEAAT